MVNYPGYITAAGITRRQMIDTIKSVFPKYEKPTMTMCCKSDEYGVQLTPEAEKLLVSSYGWHPGLGIRKPKNHSNKAKGNRLYVRVDDALYKRVLDLSEKMAFASMQDLVEAALQAFVDRHGGAE